MIRPALAALLLLSACRHYPRNYVHELGAELQVSETVMKVHPVPLRTLKSMRIARGESVLDIGTGNGLLGLVAAKRGASRVLATDINPRAVEDSALNAKRLGLDRAFESRLVKADSPEAYSVVGDERFNLIVSDPPWGDAGTTAAELRPDQYLGQDPELVLLHTMILEAPRHLKPGGRLLIVYGARKDLIERLAARAGLTCDVVDHWRFEWTKGSVIDVNVFQFHL